MKNKYFYPIFKLKAKSWIRYWLLKKTEFKGKLSEILTGFSFNLQNTLDRKFKLFEIEGNSVQDGTPSPDNEVPILSSGDNGSITEKIVNENLWSSIWEQGYINANGVNENNSALIRTKDYIYFEPEQKYAIKRSIATAYTNVRGYDKNKRFIGTGSNVIVLYSGGVDTPMQATIQTCVLATKPGVYYLRFNDASNNLSTEYMMVKGDTPEDYVPHEEQNYSIEVQRPMFSIGDVRDYFDRENKLEKHPINRYIFTGEESFTKLNSNYNTVFQFTGLNTLIKKPATSGDIMQTLSNYFNGSYSANNVFGSNVVGLGVNSSGNINIGLGLDSEITTVEALKTDLAQKYANGKPVYIDYILATPLNLPCTEEQIEALENLPSTYKDFTIIQSEDEVQPYLRIQYWESDENG